MKMTILIIPSIPNDLKLTAQGYRKTTSMSKRTKRMATRKNLTEKGILAFPIDLIPHSKFSSLISEDLFGPNLPEMMIIATTNPTANSICIRKILI